MFNSLSVLDVNCGYEPEEPLEMRFYSLLNSEIICRYSCYFCAMSISLFFFSFNEHPFFIYFFFFGGGGVGFGGVFRGVEGGNGILV